MTESTVPTVVLVHGAFADSTSWSGVIADLQERGIPVVAPANPLRGLAGDAAYIASVAAQIDGPVVLVGHSYGGGVITVAGAADNVAGLVYIAAYVLEEGESLGELQGRFPASPLGDNLVAASYPVEGGEPGTEFTIAPAKFPEIFAADVPAATTEVLAVAQRALSAKAFAETASVAAWKTKPSWALVAGADLAINPDVERFGAERAGAKVVEADGASHAVAVSRPKDVAALIAEAVAAVAA
ncbi:alpha/beta hydrolase [Actinomadura parmotrematis]|uniref:Alpha/beta hydrolase n=1 Tax=Actinomadura parmotrematis TaxID=2864039 RepID=A0ABS7FK34_9ACTN|nr:alpha/beta hydrolase [Actinomadura parmotrematis]MBW8480737.1 alpha/beta hydrolase [Actinomadura parmotrematis]